MGRLATFTGMGIGAFSLAVQFFLTISSRLVSGDSWGGALLFYFGFFTIITNLMLVLIYASAVLRAKGLAFFRRQDVRAMMAGLITLVMVFYHFLLAETWDPQGWFTVCDILLHYVTPTIYLLWWWRVADHGGVRFRDIPAMFILPILYVIYTMIFGVQTGYYPYPVLEAHRLGYGQVMLNIAVLIGLTGVLYGAVILVDKRLSRRRAKMT